MTNVAFFRNLNQGQRGHPSTEQLVEAFTASGATGVRPVRSNGTVVFEAADPLACLAAAVDHLSAVSPWRDAAFARTAEWLAARASELPATVPPALVELSLFDDGRELAEPLPMPGKGCTVVAAGRGYAITVNAASGTSQATPTLERELGTPVTSRSATTVRLLVDSF